MKKQFDNKLTDTLLHFNKYELNQLRKYICSPFFNENEQLVLLYDLFSQCLKNEGHISLDKEGLWAKLYPTKKYNDTRFRRLNSDLLKLVEGFLAYKSYTENPIVEQNFLFQAVNERQLTRLYNSTLRQVERLQTRQELRNAAYYYEEYRMQMQKAILNEQHFKRSNEINIDGIVDNLDFFYLSEKLKYYCELVNSKRVFQIDYEPIFVEEILAHLKKVNYEHIPSIGIYYRILLTMQEEEEEDHFRELVRLLEEHSTRFPLEEARMMYGFAQNYCIKKINNGQSHYLKELFKLYQRVLDKSIILHNDVLSPWDYKNIVTVGIRTEAFEWIESFIKKYKEKLPLEYRENAYTYNLAKYHFSKKDYTQVIALLSEVEYQDVFYLLDSKSMLLKTYYETDEEEALYALIDSFKVLLSRKKTVVPAYRTNYMNLIKHTRKLLDVKNGQTNKLALLKEQLDKDSNVADLTWLRKKIEELEVGVK